VKVMCTSLRWDESYALLLNSSDNKNNTNNNNSNYNNNNNDPLLLFCIVYCDELHFYRSNYGDCEWTSGQRG
jgi:hypothetical protein